VLPLSRSKAVGNLMHDDEVVDAVRQETLPRLGSANRTIRPDALSNSSVARTQRTHHSWARNIMAAKCSGIKDFELDWRSGEDPCGGTLPDAWVDLNGGAR
jgi:hypothetical protein